MKILIVGAGTVGQVYGHHLSLGGAEITYYIKEKYLSDLKNGLTLFPLNQNSNPSPIFWRNFEVICTNQEVAKTDWDYILLTLPSNILYTEWLGEFAKSCPKSTTIITLQPNISDKAELEKFFSKSNIILGVITLIAFNTPLTPEVSNSPQKTGVAFWLPPFAKAPFDGDIQRVKPLLEIFSKGKFPVSFKPISKNPEQIAFAANFLNIFVFVLENQKWKLHEFETKEKAKLLIDALQESLTILERKTGKTKPLWTIFLGRLSFFVLIKLSKFLMPFDLEKYLEVHFTKVSPQMRRNLDELTKMAEEYQIPYPTIKRMLEAKLTLPL